MPKLKDQQDADRQFDPYSNPTARDLYRQEQETGKDPYVNAGQDQLDAHLREAANDKGKNILDAKTREDTSNQFNYAKSETKEPRSATLKGIAKKKGPLGLILGFLFGGLFGITVLFSPGIALVHLKEVFTEDLNDQVSAMDMRTTHVFRAKLKDLGKSASVCGPGVAKFRCGLRGMSDRQIRNFEKAGIEIEKGEKNSVTRKTAIKSLTFTSSTGGKIRVTNEREINRMLVDRNVRNQIRRAYNPLFYGLWDKTAGKVFKRYGHTKSSHLTGTTDEDRDKAVNQSVAGEQADLDAESGKRPPSDDDPDTNDNGNDKYNEDIDKFKEFADSSSGFKSVFSGAVKGVGVIGTVDTACTVYNTSRMVEAGAKILRARQLVGFALVYLNFADKIKAGDATPEEAEYLGNKLTKIDTDAKIISESSHDGKEVDNPYYGKNAFDSEGAKTAFHNDAPNLTARAQQYMAGGAMVGTLAKVNDKVSSILGGRSNARSTCKTVQNPFVRAGSFIIGGIVAIGSFGTSTAVSIAGSVALSLALPILTSYLKDMVAGTTVDADTEGVDAGNAVFSGSGILLGDMAKTRGMQPATEGQIKEYQAATSQTKQDIIATEVESAKDEPFNAMNQYSFLGMFTRKLLPLHNTGSSSIASLALQIPSLFSSSLVPSTHAVGDYNPDRFKKCSDGGYEELGIDADIFCNVRYTMSSKELGMDTDDVYKYMGEDNDFVDDETGEAKDGDYKDFLEECVDRDWGWGEASEEESSDFGKNCIDGRSKFSASKLNNFRVYTMDRSIADGMDNGPEQSTEDENNGVPSSATGSSFRIASFNVLGTSHTDGPSANKPGWPTWSERIKASLRVIKSNNLEIIAFQEFEPSQRQYLRQHLPDYGQSSHGKESDSIMWDSDRFSLEDKGTWQTVYFGGPIEEPWVKLKDKDTEQVFYVLSVHDPINRGQGSAETRYQNALKHRALIQRLHPNAPVLLVGDFNSAYTKDGGAGAASDAKLTYCVLAVAGPMNDAYDLSVPRREKCPNKPRQGVRNYIDHIYLSPEIQVEKDSFKEIQSGANSNGSDHPTIFADVTIPSDEDAPIDLPSKDGWVWPVPGVSQMGILPYGGRNSDGDTHKGIDIGISGGGALGKPVVAAHDGKVVYVGGERSACGAYVVIKATGTNYYAAYQHVAGIKVQKDDQVIAGKPIAEVGRQGGSTCGSQGFYHLHFSVESIFSASHPVSTYADPHPHGTINPLSVLPR